MRRLIELLREPLLEGMDVDGVERLDLHHRVVANKNMVRRVFIEFHHLFHKLNTRFLSGNGLAVELGAGVLPMRDSYPDVLATDVVASPHLDRIINAEAMELEAASVKAIYGQNCFHHFAHPDRFFKELDRVLILGGGAILLEPYYGPCAGYLYKRLTPTEGFDKTYPSWETPAAGPMNGANQALSYIVFVRDREEFTKKYPSLQIVYMRPVGNYLKYLISGGLNFRQLLPNWMMGAISLLECLLNPFNRFLALHHVIVIRKKM